MPITRSKEGRCTVGLVCPVIERSDGITISGDLLASHLPYFMRSMPIAVRTSTVPLSHMFASCEDVYRARDIEPQSVESKEAIVQRESLEFMSHERRLAMSGMIWMTSTSWSSCGHWLRVSKPTGAENERQAAASPSALLGAPWVRHG
jgi:hypothetical protein